MIRSDFDYSVLVFREDGTALDARRLKLDPEPLVEALVLDGIRRGDPPGRLANGTPRSLHPVWQEDTPPRVAALQARLGAGDSALTRDYPVARLKPAAEQVAAELVEKGTLTEGERYLYLINATRREAAAGPPALRIGAVAKPLPIREDSSLSEHLACARPVGEHTGADFPVFIPGPVLTEIAEQSAAAGEVETGGVLIGHLHRDASVPELFVEVTAAIPAPHTEAAATKLTFTDRTWTGVRDAIRLRGLDEVSVGWWHLHPFKMEACKECEKARDRTCLKTSVFLSPEDRLLHRAIFPRVYGLALVVGRKAGGGGDPAWGVFGWKDGAIGRRPRGVHVVTADDDEGEAPLGGDNYAST